jgi:multidrug resistance protein, MATE family
VSSPTGAGVPPATFRVLIALAWPIVLARATQSVVSVTDALMVAPLGEAELAATTTGALNTILLIILPMGMAFIVQSFAAQLTGQGRAGEARRYAWYGLAIAAAAMALALVTIPFIPLVIGQLGAEPRVKELMADYMQLRLLSVGGAVGIEVLGNWYAGLGNTRMQMAAGFVTMAVNIPLNWVLIYGNLGAPELGVHGAAIASATASWVGFAVLAWAFHRGWGGAPRPAGPLRLRRAELRRVIRFGLPNGINWFLEFAAFIVFLNVVIVDLGTSTLAAMNAVLQVNMLSFMPAFGIASAGAILAGQAIGRGAPDQVGRILILTLRTAAVWMATIGLTYLVAPEPIIRQFKPDDLPAVELIAAGTIMLRLSAAWQLFDAAAMTLSEILRAAGDTAWPMYARLALAWVLFIPAGVLSVMVFEGGEVAAMLCLVSYLAALAGALTWRFRSGAWRRIDLTGAEPRLLEEAPAPGGDRPSASH